MGGEGAMMAANQSLKSNRNLLAKRRERKGLSGSYAHLKMADFPKASQLDLKRLRAKLEIDRKRTRRNQVLIFVFIITVLVCLFGAILK